MGLFILRRLGVMILTALCLTFIVFWLTNLQPNLEKLAKTQGNARMSDTAVETWLGNRGYSRNVFVKYGEWLGVLPGYVIEGSDGDTRARCADGSTVTPDTARFCGVLQGDWGYSTVFRDEVATILGERGWQTAKLMFFVMLVMVPGALIIGVLAGMKEGSRTDRSLSTVSILSTATPEYVSGVVFIAVFASRSEEHTSELQ